MTHPKLPPGFVWDRYHSRIPQSYLAAILEVEWRKLAEETEDEADQYYYSNECHNDGPERDQFLALCRKQGECEAIAREWRAWGEKTK